MYYRPLSSNRKTLGEALDQMIDELKLKPRMNELRIKKIWQELMGKPIVKHTVSIQLKSGKLYINVDSPALKQELYYSRSKIKELLNKELDELIVHEVLIY